MFQGLYWVSAWRKISPLWGEEEGFDHILFQECKAYIGSLHGEKSIKKKGFDHIVYQECKAYIGSLHGEKSVLCGERRRALTTYCFRSARVSVWRKISRGEELLPHSVS